MQENAILQFQTDKYMMFLLVIAMGSSLLHCSMDDFSKVNEMRIKVVSSYPSGHVQSSILSPYVQVRKSKLEKRNNKL